MRGQQSGIPRSRELVHIPEAERGVAIAITIAVVGNHFFNRSESGLWQVGISTNCEGNESTFHNSCSFAKFAARFFRFGYGARKYPEMSMTTCVGSDPKILMDPFAAGTIARLEVIAPSPAFRVETSG